MMYPVSLLKMSILVVGNSKASDLVKLPMDERNESNRRLPETPMLITVLLKCFRVFGIAECRVKLPL